MMTPPTVFMLLLLAPAARASTISGQVVQFAVYAPQESDVTHLFPGAQIDHTWNNVFLVSVWTNDPDALIPSLQRALDSNAEVIQTIVPPLVLQAATRKWLEYNLVWLSLFVLMFFAGCACGGVAILKCNSIKNATASRRKCRT